MRKVAIGTVIFFWFVTVNKEWGKSNFSIKVRTVSAYCREHSNTLDCLTLVAKKRERLYVNIVRFCYCFFFCGIWGVGLGGGVQKRCPTTKLFNVLKSVQIYLWKYEQCKHIMLPLHLRVHCKRVSKNNAVHFTGVTKNTNKIE